jgi:DNA-binding PadR family transcriptional regulator
MADGLHLSRMQLYRVLQNLQKQGIIETSREKIRILNKTALYNLSR